MRNAVIIIGMFLLCGCNRDNESGDNFVNARISISIPAEVSSSMLRVFLYDTSSGEMKGQFFMSGTAGDTVFTCQQSLREGIYDMVAYNFDLPDTFIRGESSISTLEAYTNKVDAGISAVFKSEGDVEYDVVNTPDVLAVAVVRGVSVEDGSVISGGAVTVTRSDDVSIPADGLSYVRSSSAVVGGFASSYFLGTGKTGNGDHLYFELHTFSVQDNSGYLNASFSSFGKISTAHDFRINVLTSAESVVYPATTGDDFVFPGRIEIKKPDAGDTEGGSGFSPRVGEWNDLSINVPIVQ